MLVFHSFLRSRDNAVIDLDHETVYQVLAYIQYLIILVNSLYNIYMYDNDHISS